LGIWLRESYLRFSSSAHATLAQVAVKRVREREREREGGREGRGRELPSSSLAQ